MTYQPTALGGRPFSCTGKYAILKVIPVLVSSVVGLGYDRLR